MSTRIGPAFGEADLTNCELEQIHLAGSIQPFGLLLTLREPGLVVVQASANIGPVLGVTVEDLLSRPVSVLGGDLASVLGDPAYAGDLAEPLPLRCVLSPDGRTIAFDGVVHRAAHGLLVVELEPAASVHASLAPDAASVAPLDSSFLVDRLPAVVRRMCAASRVDMLADTVAQSVRELTGYDRVMVYRFDPDGHGQIISEARDLRLESLLGHRYPATDIPQRARQLYVRNRVRVLVDVHYMPVPLVPSELPNGRGPLDMSMCQLRSMSPLHLQYLKNMGVTATLVVSLVRDGALWGLIAAHHYRPRNIDQATRSAMAMLAEVVSTRLAAIENYAYAQVAILVRRLEQRLIEATSHDGDWRLALFRNPRTLLGPVDATGAALFYDDEILTAGEVPSTAEMRELMQWIDARYTDSPFVTASVEKADPALSRLTPVASGVLALKLSVACPDYLMWFRKEQLQTLTWAGDPEKAVVGTDPKDLSPRRSFAAWSQIVRGTALAWNEMEIAIARALGTSLVDIIVQVHGVRLLIAQDQWRRMQETVEQSHEPILIADAGGRVSFCNSALRAMVGCPSPDVVVIEDLAAFCSPAERLLDVLGAMRQDRQPWRGEMMLACGDGRMLPVNLRIDVVPGLDGNALLGFLLIFRDLSEERRAAAARARLEEALSEVAERRLDGGADAGADAQPDEVIRAILTNASIAAMDIAEGTIGQTMAPVLEEVEAATRRATEFYNRIQSFRPQAPSARGRGSRDPGAD